MSDFLNVVKKPIAAKALKWGGTYADLLLLQRFCGSQEVLNKWFYFDGEELFINTLEGSIHTSVGLYIIKGNHDEYWSIKETIFLDTYEIL
ncbi:hypothetical protein HCC36_15995 [Listeria booriae]|uniref:Uncharacterized protein n=1 Tax=Listeria booriae TaxID=1552123 RepID=A0A842G0F1_9LIST|nr:hypothetical protein [Listeria booriae]MBC2294725.1 hypothetical protein [Listeria booriae]